MSATGTAAACDFVEVIKDYLGHLKTEIVEAQKMRMQVRGAKIIFLGGLYAYALPRNDALAVLVAPFAAFAFDCVIFGLTYNIQEIGAYICDYIEPLLPKPSASEQAGAGLEHPFVHWEMAKRNAKYRNWGRGFARIGNYGVTLLVCIVAFGTTWHVISLYSRSTLLVALTGSYIFLMWFEFKTRNLSGTLFPIRKATQVGIASTLWAWLRRKIVSLPIFHDSATRAGTSGEIESRAGKDSK